MCIVCVGDPLLDDSSTMIDGKIGQNPSAASDARSGQIAPLQNQITPLEEIKRLETLNEPVSQTIWRDMRRVGVKLKHVLIPHDTVKELRNWDLWGPLFLCLLMASTLSLTAQADQTALVFAAVFVIVWCGAGIVTLNAALLGGTISFLQSVCVLGYCLFPLNLASIACRAWSNKPYQMVIVSVGFLWATRASVGFMAQLVPADRKALAVFPVIFFYLTISWMILSLVH